MGLFTGLHTVTGSVRGDPFVRFLGLDVKTTHRALLSLR